MPDPTTTSVPAYRRVLLKLSGDSFTRPGQTGVSMDEVSKIAAQAKRVADRGVQLAIVVGGGNIIRGAQFSKAGNIVTQATADYMGMLATVINGIILQDFLEKAHQQEVRTLSAIEVRAFTEPYIRRRALGHMEKGRVVILAGGSSNPRFTTDTAGVLRAIELEAQMMIKGTKVDGVYSRDPSAGDGAEFISKISQHDFIVQKLGILDRTAVTLAGENKMPIRVLNILKKGNLKKALGGEDVGSVIVPD